MNIVESIETFKYFGVAPLVQGAWHRFLKGSGLLKRRFPALSWTDQQLLTRYGLNGKINEIKELSIRKFFPLKDVLLDQHVMDSVRDRTVVIEKADRLRQGIFTYFSNQDVKREIPVNWHLNPFNAAQWPKGTHWCDLGYFSKERSDIKMVWEINRFSWVYTLVRAYALTKDQTYSDCFWKLFEDWTRQNQPNLGVNWVSGQECSLRLMACCFAFFAFRECKSTTHKRARQFLLFCAVHAERIEKFLAHAVRQKTNHAMTEAAGLYTVGLLFPFIKKAAKWERLGKQILEQEGLRQIYDDGAYVQQSMNYHRVMLCAYLWCLQLAELNQDRFSDSVKGRLKKASEFLYQMQDPISGRVPNYGANDGALIFPLNSCDYLDYRPILQAMNYLLNRTRLYEAGPWDEDLLWFFGPDALCADNSGAVPISSEFNEGGYYTIRNNDTWAMIRCHTYKDRVGHVDMLHLDIWADGENLLRDCGSYRYFAPEEPRMEAYFKSIWAHNTVIIDGQSPLRQISRFMMIPWPRALRRNVLQNEKEILWEGENYAYDRSPWNIIHHRKIKSMKDRWEIEDILKGQGRHQVEIRWHLPVSSRILTPQKPEIQLSLMDRWFLSLSSQAFLTFKLLEGQNEGGWESLYYNTKNAIKTLSVKAEIDLPGTFMTVIWKEKG